MRLYRQSREKDRPPASPAPIRPAAVLPAALLEHARILPSREAILPYLPKGGLVVEVGVALGDYSALLMENCRPDMFVAIDIFTLHEFPMVWDRPSTEALGGLRHEAFYRRRFAASIASGQMRVLHQDSVEALCSLSDRSIDVLYLDANHSFDFVQAELAAAEPKMADGGWIVLNDYIMTNIAGGAESYGVVQAAHEFMLRHAYEMVFLALHPFMYCDVAIRKAGGPAIAR